MHGERATAAIRFEKDRNFVALSVLRVRAKRIMTRQAARQMDDDMRARCESRELSAIRLLQGYRADTLGLPSYGSHNCVISGQLRHSAFEPCIRAGLGCGPV